MLPIKYTLLPVFGLASFIIFYVGFLNFVTTDAYSSDLEELVVSNNQLQNAHKMILADKIASQSVRNFILTEDSSWEKEYAEKRESLGTLIAQSKLYAKFDYVLDMMSRTQDDYKNLEQLESEIFQKINNNKADHALQIINGKEYKNLQKIFSSALNENLDYYDRIVTSANEATSQRVAQSQNQAATVLIFASLIATVVMIGTFYISREITQPIQKLEKMMTKFSQNGKIMPNQKEKVKMSIKELDGLFRHFDYMARTVEKTISLEKRLVSKLRETDRQKNEFASMISHELKSPLVPIMGYAEILRNPKMGPLNDNQVDAINEIYDSSKRLEKLIGDILTVQKLEMGKSVMNFNKVRIETGEFIKSQISNFAPIAEKKKIELVYSNEATETLYTDQNRLGQVFANLIENALDFVPEKNGRIEVGFYNDEDDIVFFVMDNGTGIPKSSQQNLFRKFYQVDTTARRHHTGSGLGLAICKGIVDGLDGKIWVESDLGKGTTFYFKIPKTPMDVVTTSS